MVGAAAIAIHPLPSPPPTGWPAKARNVAQAQGREGASEMSIRLHADCQRHLALPVPSPRARSQVTPLDCSSKSALAQTKPVQRADGW